MNSLKDQEDQGFDILETKNKRDQYVLEIRKGKVEEILRNKRIKLASNRNNNYSKENNHPNDVDQTNNDGDLNKLEELPSLEKLTSEFFNAVQNDNLELLLDVVITIQRKMSINENPPLQDFIDTGLFPHLIKFLDEEYKSLTKLQYEVLWIVCNSFSGTPEQSKKIITDDLIKTLISFIWDKRPEIVDTTIWTLANISADDDFIRLKLLDLGLVAEIGTFLKTAGMFPGDLLKNIIWLISNLALIKDHFEKFNPITPMLPVFLAQSDLEMLSKTCYTYSYISQTNSKEMLDTLFSPQVIKRFIDLLDHIDASVKSPSLRTLGNLLSNDGFTTKAVEAGCLPKLEQLMSHRRYMIRRESIWALSNVVADGPVLIAKVLQTAIISKVLNVIILDVKPCKCEALVCLMNALLKCSTAQIGVIVKTGVARTLTVALGSDDVSVVLHGLACLETVLQKGAIMQEEVAAKENPFLLELHSENTLTVLENLQSHRSEDVYSKASDIIEKYLDYQE